MSCFSLFSSSKDHESDMTANLIADHEKGETSESIKGKRLTYHELASATQKFKNLIGKGKFGCVYKGLLKSGEIVAVKLLKDKDQKFNVDALMFRHSNLLMMIDYCTEGDQRFVVYEYMPLGSLQNHLLDLKPRQEPIDWDTRLKIALGVARGLEYLHCRTNPPVMYRNLKLSNILLDNDFNPKLSDFGLVHFESDYGETTILKLTYDYCPPEYAMAGKWTLKTDIYSFGVVLLELITGRKGLDKTKKEGELSLVDWSRPLLKDRNKFIQLVDPLLQGRFPVCSLARLVKLAAVCLHRCPSTRPSINIIVGALQNSDS